MTGNKARGWLKPALFALFLLAVVILARLLGLGERLGDLRDWIEGLGAWGPVVFIPLYALGVVAALPGSALTVAAGTLFGSVLGVILVINAATLGASLSFPSTCSITASVSRVCHSGRMSCGLGSACCRVRFSLSSARTRSLGE